MIELLSKVKKDPEEKYTAYHNFRQNLSRIQSYQVLAILRGEKEKALKVSFASIRDHQPSTKTSDDDGISKMMNSLLYKLPRGYRGPKNVICQKQLKSWKHGSALGQGLEKCAKECGEDK